MNFGAPEWLFLLPALAVVAWRRREFGLHEPLRALGILSLVLALADPRLQLSSPGLDLWVLADRSDSNAGQMATQAREIESILERSRGREDRVFYIDYAGEATRREFGDPVFAGQTYQTRTGNALQFALGQTERARAARLLVLSDGYATEPLGNAVEQVLRSGVPVDYRILGETATADWRVSGLNAAPRVLAGESFLMEIEITGPGEQSVPWEVRRNGVVAQSGIARLHAGTARVSLADRVTTGGAVKYEAIVKPASDAHPENNIGTTWIEVTGGPRIILVTNYPDDPLVRILESQGLEVEKVDDPTRLSTGLLAGARGLILNNVPAHKLPQEFLSGLDFFIRDQGAGLLMVGGENSFGSGGYYGSVFDSLLPVSMELREDQRKRAASLAIVMDRSGSMSGSVGGGLTKMDLANSGAARGIELLGYEDFISVHAVDRAAHEIIPLSKVGPARQALVDTVRTVRSTGGGIVIMEALQAAWNELNKSNTNTKHIIMFADANDSGQNLGDYQTLVSNIAKDGITVTVIGLGHETNRFGELLKDVAKIGGGRIFFSADPNDLPAIFAQETVSIARSAFIKEPTATAPKAGWSEVAAQPPNWLREVDGYNLAYLRPEATGPLITTDEYAAPLVATWQRGAGRVGAVTFPLGGEYSARARAWPGYGDFVQTISRWLAGEDALAGLALRTEVEGEQLTLDLFYDETWTARIAASPPTVILAENRINVSATERRGLTWEKISPGRFRVTTNLPAGRMVRGAVQVGDRAIPFGPIAAVGAAEWNYDRTRLSELRDLSLRSGGGERLDLAQVWQAPRPVSWRDLRNWFLIAWAVFFLVDAALTRLGIPLAPKALRV